MLNTIFGKKGGERARSGLALIVTSYALVGCVSAIDDNSRQTAATNEPSQRPTSPSSTTGRKTRPRTHPN
jgi:hypothetical protein